MLQVIPKSKALAVLTALVVIGMWSNAIAAVFCPYMSGRSDSCLMQNAKVLHSDHARDASSSIHRDHMDHTQMSEMDMQDMDMSDMRMGETRLQSENSSVNSKELLVARDQQPNSEAITQPSEPCSHCMMHSRSGAEVPFRAAVQNSTAYQVVAADTRAQIVDTVPSALSVLELHDHGPPGSNAPLYVLVSAFRI